MSKLKSRPKDNLVAVLWMLLCIAISLFGLWIAGQIYARGGSFNENVGVGIVVALPAVIFSVFLEALKRLTRRDYFITLAVLFIAMLVITSEGTSLMGEVLKDPGFYWPTFIVNGGALLVSYLLALRSAPARTEQSSTAQAEPVARERKPASPRRSSSRVMGALILGLMLGAFVRIM